MTWTAASSPPHKKLWGIQSAKTGHQSTLSISLNISLSLSLSLSLPLSLSLSLSPFIAILSWLRNLPFGQQVSVTLFSSSVGRSPGLRLPSISSDSVGRPLPHIHRLDSLSSDQRSSDQVKNSSFPWIYHFSKLNFGCLLSQMLLAFSSPSVQNNLQSRSRSLSARFSCSQHPLLSLFYSVITTFISFFFNWTHISPVVI